MSKRLLIISAAIGGGHVAAAKALEAAAKEKGLVTTHVDLLDYTTLPFRRMYRQAYFDLVRNAPDFIDWLGRRLDRSPSEKKSRQERLRARLTRLISYHLPRLINRYQPDAILHTHFLPAEILSTRLSPVLLRPKHDKPIPQATVITDFFAHKFWMQANIDHYYVASPEVAVHLEASGIEASRVTVTGIPIDLRFLRLEPKQEARKALNHTSERDRLLVMAGGFDKATLLALVKELGQLRWPLHASIICGRSQDLFQSANQAIQSHEGLIDFEVLQFSDEIPRHMAAADLLLGKPGGLTTSEALAAGLPFAIVKPYPIQEEANSNYVLEHGAAMRIEPLSLLQYKLKQFFADPAKRERMAQAAFSLGKPNASKDIIEHMQVMIS